MRMKSLNLIPEIREDVLRKSVARARAQNIVLPTFAQQKDPKRVLRHVVLFKYKED